MESQGVSASQTTQRPRAIPRIGEQIRVGRDFELVWGDFLHGFYAHRLASYFAFHLQ